MNKLLVFASLILSLAGQAQTGGTTAFNFLNLPYSARVVGLGGNFITVRDGDINMGIQNPALLNESMNGRGSLSQGLIAGGMNAGALAYGHTFTNGWTGAGHLRYLSYGKMRRTDVNGTDLGQFTPGDFSLGASMGKSINERMHMGATLNILYSQLDSYTAFGTSLDLGGCYTNEEKRLVLSGIIRNLGVQWKSYNGTRNQLPLTIQAGVSHKLSHAPFRFSLLAKDLQTWDLTYNDPNAKETTDPLTGEVVPIKKAGFTEKLVRHLGIQTEILFGEKLHLRVGFDYQRRQELKVVNRPGIAGFSFGAGFYFKRFTLDYGLLCYSAAGSQHALTLTLPLVKS